MKSVIGGIRLASGKHVLGMNKTRHIFGTAKVGDRGQIVIPKDARELYGIRPGDTLRAALEGRELLNFEIR